MIQYKYASGCFLALLGFLMVGPSSHAQGANKAQEPNKPMVFEGTVGGWRIIEEGQPPVMIHATVEDMKRFREANPNARPGQVQAASTANDLTYHGGIGGIGVETAPKVFLVLWGSQWNNNDPSGEAAILQSFYQGVGGSSWANSVTQYCQGVTSGTVFCNGSGQAAGNPSGIFAGVWADNASLAPSHPRQSQIAAEAVSAAQHFGNTTAASNASAQYVIATATGHNSRGFGTQYCAYHSSTSSTDGNIAYTNLPYITDAGASCGANFNGLGPDAGVTIVGGHEMAETMTDQFPNGGWLDSSGAENGDKCAWISSGQGAASDITLSSGTFPVQSLWSNAFNSGSGGCVLSYP
jgi:serine protease